MHLVGVVALLVAVAAAPAKQKLVPVTNDAQFTAAADARAILQATPTPIPPPTPTPALLVEAAAAAPEKEALVPVTNDAQFTAAADARAISQAGSYPSAKQTFSDVSCPVPDGCMCDCTCTIDAEPGQALSCTAISTEFGNVSNCASNETCADRGCKAVAGDYSKQAPHSNMTCLSPGETPQPTPTTEPCTFSFCGCTCLSAMAVSADQCSLVKVGMDQKVADFGCSSVECNHANAVVSCQDAKSNPPPSDAGGGGSCFPADARVALAGNTTKPMKDLVLGDKVHVGNGQYSEVFLFSHQMSEVRAQFVTLTASAAEISLTPGHFVHANGQLVLAGSVKVGDLLHLGDGSEAAVLSTSHVWKAGLFNPHTKAGDIVVDGVKASCYTEAVHPTLAHALLMPVRALYDAGLPFGESLKAGTDSPLHSMLPRWAAEAIRA